MERLTYDFCIGSVHCNQVHGADNLECSEVCRRQGDDGCKTCPIAKAFDRLAAIEDILGDEYDLDRLRELVQADREGRVHILAPSNEPLTLEFDVVDTKTGQYPDWEHIARTEDWADGLVYCDIDGIAIQEDGSLILLDECGNCVSCPRDRFEIRRPLEMED